MEDFFFILFLSVVVLVVFSLVSLVGITATQMRESMRRVHHYRYIVCELVGKSEGFHDEERVH